ncbi:homocysteine-induced endoplasmic reticulum protein [Haematobia irritans]|uniref:Putative cysteine-responsive endoplasmic reticulum-resident ubiquitin-like domain member 2 protein n=2 Tax=Haematobia irritans TaxID=7368 RepID=A0A1L8EI72_HAEIR
MDETNTTNSTSAAAAVTSTKLEAAPNSTLPTTKTSTYVKLLIKASNQQYDDQILEVCESWTVNRLKSHLALVYPSKPPAADQKLIYSGQLLNDSLQLKDVIRSYKDVYTHNHIIHLVYTPKNLPPFVPTTSKKSKPAMPSTGNTNISSEEGLRQRNTTGNVQRQSPQTTDQMSYYSQYLPQNLLTNGMGAGSPMTVPGYGQYNMQAFAMQQAAMYGWMQQVYSQYMEQCLRVSGNTNGSSDDANRTGAAGPLPPFTTFPQNPFLQFPQAVISPPVAPANTTEQQQPQNPEQPAQAQVAPQPRFPNMPQEEADNRDWLDNIFSITRLALFLTILYFNSSPLRCLAVVMIAGGIYLYHIGVFRLRHERNNNNLNRNNNAVQNAAVDQIRQGVDQQQPQQQEVAQENPNPNEGENNMRAPVGNNNEHQSSAPNSDVVDSENIANNESMMSTLRTFVVTFFTSLLPETPAL